MKERLHSTCRLPDGVHWLLMRPDGTIYAVSPWAYSSEEAALVDLGVKSRE